MKKAFFFTLSVISMLTILFSVILLSHQLVLNPAQFLAFEKVSYAWSDISEDLSGASGLNATKVENVLNVQDELPASSNVSNILSTYISFVRRFYNSSDLTIGLYSPAGQEIIDFNCFGKNNCNDDVIQFHVLPFNITFQYPDLNKKQRDIVCYADGGDSFPTCDFTAAKSLGISINLTQMNFSCDPGIYNNCTHANIEWNNNFNPVFGCTSGVNCINYTLTIRDAASRVYTCRGIYGANSGNTKRVNCDAGTWKWDEEKEAVLQIKSPPCNVDLKFGHDGRFRIETTAPGGATCDVDMSSDFSFVFNTSDFYMDFSTELMVRDQLLNYSAKTSIQ